MNMLPAFKKYWFVIVILLIGGLLRVYALDRGDPLSDEVLYGFRAIGMLDFDFALRQPTTLQLFVNRGIAIPSWAHLSFHDHPLFVFLVQHWSMGLFGVQAWSMRLPSALFGIGTVLLLYYLAQALFSKRAAVIAAALAAVNVLLVYVSRTGVQESQVIFFMVLAVLCFVRAQRDPRWYCAWGVAWGLGFFSKYTVGFLLLSFAWYLLLYARDAFKKALFYAGAVLVFIGALSSVIYNIMLYKTFGHFDFQLFYLFGQKVSYWESTPGKDIGGLSDRVIGIFSNLFLYNEPVFNMLAAVAIVVFIALCIRMPRSEEKRNSMFLCAIIGANLLLYVGIGPSPRFLTMLIPWLAVAVAAVGARFFGSLARPWQSTVGGVAIVVLVWQGWFAYNSSIAIRPVGIEGVTYSKIHWDMHPWGYNELDVWLSKKLAGSYPAFTVPYSLPFLEDIKQKAIQEATRSGKKPYSALFVYSDNMSDLATLWVVNRRSLYEAWPMISAVSYQTTLESKGESFYREAGIQEIYFIQNTDAVLQNYSDRITDVPQRLESELQKQHVEPERIYNRSREEAFRIYRIPVTVSDKT